MGKKNGELRQIVMELETDDGSAFRVIVVKTPTAVREHFIVEWSSSERDSLGKRKWDAIFEIAEELQFTKLYLELHNQKRISNNPMALLGKILWAIFHSNLPRKTKKELKSLSFLPPSPQKPKQPMQQPRQEESQEKTRKPEEMKKPGLPEQPPRQQPQQEPQKKAQEGEGTEEVQLDERGDGWLVSPKKPEP